MAPVTYHTSRPDTWAVPRWRTDPSERRRIYGPLRPMQSEHPFLDWLRRHTFH